MANSSVCLTPACLQAATTLVWQLAPNWDKMDPCTEFDKMVCHGFRDRNIDDTNTLRAVMDQTNRIIKNIIEGEYADAIDYQAVPHVTAFASGSIDEANFAMLKRDYEACMDVDAITAAGSQPLVDLIAELNSIWPIVDSDDVESKVTEADYASLSSAVYFLEAVGIRSLVNVGVGSDPLTPSKQSILIEKPAFSLAGNLTAYADEDAVNSLGQQIAQTLLKGYYPVNITSGAADIIGQGIALLETQMFAALPPSAALPSSDPSTIFSIDNQKSLTLAELATIVPPLGLDKIIKNLAPPEYPDDLPVLVNPAVFLPNLSDILTSLPKTYIQSFLVYRVISELESSVIGAGGDIAAVDGSSSSSGGGGSKKTRPRSDTCLQHVDDALRFVIGRFFASATYPDAARDFASKLTTSLRAQFKTRIDGLDWMSPEAKSRAKTKVDNIQQNIGYPEVNPNIRDPEDVARYYQGLNISSTDFFSNVLSARRHVVATAFRSVLEPTDRHKMNGPLHLVNAFYNVQDNSVSILAGISQLPIFSPDLPGYASYGSMGAIVGHEILHGFDSTGRLFDENAAFKTWWDNGTISAFKERAQCFIDQYGAFEYPIPGGETAKTDGEATLGENISDAGGLRIAYDAWKATQSGPGAKVDATLPGLEKFTRDQLFFMFYANTWCNNASPEYLAAIAPSDNHAPDSQRIVGAAANSRGFREAFQCQVKEPECELF